MTRNIRSGEVPASARGPHIAALLALAVIVGVYLRVRHLDSAGLWWDEFVTLGRAKLSLKDLWAGLTWQSPSDVTLDSSPPLLHILVHFLLGFAKNDVIVKLPSVVCGALTIVATFFLGKTFFDEESGLYAAILCSLSLFHINYSMETRPYSLYLFTSICALISFQLAITRNRGKYWIWYVIASVLTLYSSYLASANIASQSLFYFLYMGESVRRTGDWRRVLKASPPFFLSLAAICILYIPWVPGHWNQYRIIYSPTGVKSVNLEFFASIFKEFVAYAYQGDWPYNLFMLPFLVLGIWRCIRISRTAQLLLLLLWSLFSLLMAMALQTNIGINVRYLINNFVLIIVLAGCGVAFAASVFRGVRTKRLATFAGLSMAVVLSYPGISEFRFFEHKAPDTIKRLAYSLALEKNNVDAILFYRPRHYKVFLEWYLPDAFTYPSSFPDRSYRRFFFLAPPDYACNATNLSITVLDASIARVMKGGIVNRSPLIVRDTIEERFDSLEFYADVFAFSNVAPDMQDKSLTLYDYAKPGEALYAFETNGQDRFQLDVQAFLRDKCFTPSDATLTVQAGDDPDSLATLGEFTWKDFTDDPLAPYDQNAIRKKTAATFELANMARHRTLYIRFILHAGKIMGQIEPGPFRLTAVGPALGAPEKDAAFRYFEHVAANANVLRWAGETALVASDAVYAFSLDDARTGSGHWNSNVELERYKRLHPGQAPVSTLEFEDGRPAFAFYDPALKDPYAHAASTPQSVRTDAPAPLPIAGLKLRGALEQGDIFIDGAPLPIGVSAPPGSELFLNKNGNGLLRLTSDFTQPFERIESQAALMHAMKKRKDAGSLTCTGDGNCFAAYAFASRYPMRKATIVSYPRVLTDEIGRNAVTVSYSTDGDAYTPCAQLRSVGDFARYDGKRGIISVLEFDPPTDRLYVRYELSGAGAELWGTKAMPQTVEIDLDASRFPGAVLPGRTFNLTTPRPGVDAEIFFSNKPIELYERYQPR